MYHAGSLNSFLGGPDALSGGNCFLTGSHLIDRITSDLQSMSSLEIGLLILSAFVPCAIFVIWGWSTELTDRQSLLSVLSVFLMGATISVGLALVLEIAAQSLLAGGLGLESGAAILTVLGAVVVAPVFEELTKMLPILAAGISPEFSELEDGLIYGAAAGFGFAATENLLYFFVSWRESLMMPAGLGLLSLVVLIIVRSIGSACVHGAASSMSGLGIASRRFLHGSVLGGYVKAVGLHAAFNLTLVLFGALLVCDMPVTCAIPLAFSLLIGLVSFSWTIRRIRVLDEQPNVQMVDSGGPDDQD